MSPATGLIVEDLLICHVSLRRLRVAVKTLEIADPDFEATAAAFYMPFSNLLERYSQKMLILRRPANGSCWDIELEA